MVTLDFTKCRTKEDVEKIFDQNKEILGLINKEAILNHLRNNKK